MEKEEVSGKVPAAYKVDKNIDKKFRSVSAELSTRVQKRKITKENKKLF